MATLSHKLDFLCESALSLHTYGVPAHRLETVIQKLGVRLEIEDVQVSSIPTSIQVYVQAKDERHTRLMRVKPGDLDLGKLQDADQIISQIANFDISLLEGKKQLIALKERKNPYSLTLQVLAYALTAASVTMFLSGSWVSTGVALVVGFFAGCIFISFKASPTLSSVAEIVTAFVASITAGLFPVFVSGVDYASIVLAALIVPLPGLSLTVAMMDLASDHLVAGSARLMGSFMTLLKIFFGFFLGKELVDLFISTEVSTFTPDQSIWMIPLALFVSTLCFMVIFRMKYRDYFWVLITCAASLLLHRNIAALGEPLFASFVASCAVALIANAYARIRNLPASTLMMPGLLLLVPGSVGYRSLLSMNQRDVVGSLDLAFQTIFIGLMLVGGILLGNFIISPKRDL